MRFVEFFEIISVPDLVSDFELQIPQRMQDRLDRFFVDGILEEKKKIDIGLGMNGLPPIPSYRK